ncbi:MAG: phage tail tape measure protein, partial [Candidatus Falkowbacteria bacterium]
KGAYELVSAGLTLAQAKKSLEATLNFSTISGGQVSIDKSAKLFGAIFNKFRIDPSQAMHVSDLMVQASNKSAFTFDDLPKFFNSMQDAPTKMNAPIEEMLGMGMALRNAGQNPKESGNKINSFANALLNITAQIDRAAMREKEGKKSGSIQQYRMNLLKKIGFGQAEIWEQSGPNKGKMKSMVDIMDSLIKNSAGLTDQVKSVTKKTVFAQNASTIWSVMENLTKPLLIWNEVAGKWEDNPLSKGSSFKEMVTNLISGGEGKTESGMVSYMELLENKMKRLAETSKMLETHFGDAFAPFKIFEVDAKQGVLAGLDELIVKFPILGTAVAGVTGAVGLLAKTAGLALAAMTMLAIAGAGVKYVAADMLEYASGRNAAAIAAHTAAGGTGIPMVLPYNSLGPVAAYNARNAALIASRRAVNASIKGLGIAGINGSSGIAALTAAQAANPMHSAALAAIIAQKTANNAEKTALKTLLLSGGAATNWKTFFKEFITKGWAAAVPWIKLVFGWMLKIGFWVTTVMVLWKANFLGIQTAVENMLGAYKKGVEIAQLPLDKFVKRFHELNKLEDTSARNWAGLTVLWSSLQSFWSTGMISGTQFMKLNETGMGGTFDLIVRIGKAGEDIGKGFKNANDWALKLMKNSALTNYFVVKISDTLGIGGTLREQSEGWTKIGNAIFWVATTMFLLKAGTTIVWGLKTAWAGIVGLYSGIMGIVGAVNRLIFAFQLLGL